MAFPVTGGEYVFADRFPGCRETTPDDAFAFLREVVIPVLYTDQELSETDVVVGPAEPFCPLRRL